MDEVCDEKGIEMNDADSDDHVIKADRHNRVIKNRFRMAYYLLLYKRYQGL